MYHMSLPLDRPVNSFSDSCLATVPVLYALAPRTGRQRHGAAAHRPTHTLTQSSYALFGVEGHRLMHVLRSPPGQTGDGAAVVVIGCGGGAGGCGGHDALVESGFVQKLHM